MGMVTDVIETIKTMLVLVILFPILNVILLSFANSSDAPNIDMLLSMWNSLPIIIPLAIIIRLIVRSIESERSTNY